MRAQIMPEPLSLITILSGCEINNFVGQSVKSVCYNFVAMFDLFRLWLGAVLRGFRTHRSLMLENLALRQQLTVFKRQQPRPRLEAIDKLFWVVARRFWAHWKKALVIVLPDTVVRWHRSGFKLYWAMLCKVRKPVGGGRRISKQIREWIFQMVADNPSWGAPRIHGELLMLGFDVSETTISRWMKRAPKDPQPAKRWLAFLRNHREAPVTVEVPSLCDGEVEIGRAFLVAVGEHFPRLRDLSHEDQAFNDLASGLREGLDQASAALNAYEKRAGEELKALGVC